MSATIPSTDPIQASSSGKKKNNKKKKNANKAKEPLETSNGTAQQEPEDVEEEHSTPAEATSKQETPAEEVKEDEPHVNGHDEDAKSSNGLTEAPAEEAEAQEAEAQETPAQKTINDTTAPDSDTAARFEALTKEREELRTEVEQLRRQLEGIQGSQTDAVTQLKSELDEANSAKEHAEEQYQGLLERVNHLKTTLGDRLKRDRAELEEAKERIEELEAQNEELQGQSGTNDAEVTKLKEELQDATREATSLRSRSNLSQQNWVKEREELVRQLSGLKEEVETTTNAMGEWEVIAMEERSVKESLVDKVSELEEQVASLRGNYQDAAAERDNQARVSDRLQTALGELQEARKRELREMVESSEEQVQALKRLVQEADARAGEAEAAREKLEAELERTVPFEKEVKEKNLLIGKLRHEAIVLNDHLTKALRYLKKTKPEDNVDRHIVTNYLLHFLTLDRSDPKRFQILQVVAGYLNWTEEQREQAGLARPGTSATGSAGGSLRLPPSPFHRTPSTPSLSADFFSDANSSLGPASSASNKESLADLWTGFLERQAQEALSPDAAETGSRKGSVASNPSK